MRFVEGAEVEGAEKRIKIMTLLSRGDRKLSFDIKENVKVAMKERCFVKSVIANKANMSPPILSMILNKKRKLAENELYDLRDAMEISPTELREQYKPWLPV